MDVAVVGNKEFVLGFQMCGVKKIFLSENETFSQSFDECFNTEGVGVVIVEEWQFEQLSPAMKKKIEGKVMPVIVPLSSDVENSGADLKYLIKRCLGVDLWKD